MKKIVIALLCCALLIATVSCNENDNINLETTNSVTDTANTNTQLFHNINDANDLSPKDESMTSILEDILQQQYTWSEFNFMYPKYEITAQSQLAVNVIIPEFENVVFVFSGNLNDNISEYKMVSINAAGNVFLREHFGKTFDQIIVDEGDRANFVLSDDVMQHLYKYEEIYIYREEFYYYIRGYVHLNKLTSEHIAMLRYDENQRRPG